MSSSFEGVEKRQPLKADGLDGAGSNGPSSPPAPQSTSEPCVSIGTVAEVLCVSPQTLRYYEKLGLVVPHRSSGGTRRYSHDDLAKLIRIRRLLSQGMNLPMAPEWGVIEQRLVEMVDEPGGLDVASLAGVVSQARLTQIVNLIEVDPEVHGDILFLPRRFRKPARAS